MSELDFGIFKDFWNGHPNHLPLMGLNNDNNQPAEWNLNKSLERLDLICDNNDQELIINGIHKLLNNQDWRPHLVAILVSFKLTPTEQIKLIPELWTRLEKGSWISPQILSVLSIIDNEFELKAKEILNNGFKVNYSPMGMAEHHSARGPEGSKEASEKVTSSINSLLENQNDDFGWKGKLIKLIENKKFKTNTKHNTV
ncbi:hypothetical protein [uncultured Algibacter sp.]|uniref:hypothetical protein n=1 Tax=uncultured Algibacter sp. TaxID=298659 RepID=UPI003216E6A7